MISTNTHFQSLQDSYGKVGNRTWLESDFIQSNLDLSRNLFTAESLALRKPIPKSLEVYALLSGLPFSNAFCSKLVSIQQDISEIINNKLHYWVKPQNFGVEYCVFKWPNDKWDESWYPIIMNELSLLDDTSFQFFIQGIQVNPDGCVIARGYDKDGIIFNIRKLLKKNISFLAEKQSAWSHVPLGRILEPIGSKEFGDLKLFVEELYNVIIALEEINTVKFVHETRWYMEEKSILSTIHLD